MKDVFSIGDISKFFNIPTSTLRFWEKKGLLSPRKEDNNYREYSLPDLMKISDIVFYKNLGIPLKDILNLKNKNVKDQALFCNEHLKDLELQKEFINRQIQTLKQHQKALNIINELKDEDYIITDIDTECIVSFELTQKEKIKMYIKNPYLYSRVQHSDYLEEEKRGITVLKSNVLNKNDIIWENNNRRYAVCLMKEEVNEDYPNNINILLSKVQKKYETGYIISRFLTSAMEDGILYDFYKTYIEIKKEIN